MSKENLKDTMGSLFDGMEGFLTSKTVVGEPIYIKDTIILPLVDVSFGMGAGAFSGDKKDKSGWRSFLFGVFGSTGRCLRLWSLIRRSMW